MSKVTIFRLDTGGADAGEHLRTGNTNDPKTADLIAQGHTAVNKAYSNMYKYDYATSTVIIDTAKEQAANDRAQRKADLANRRRQNTADLVASIGTIRALPEVNVALDKIIEILEKID